MNVLPVTPFPDVSPELLAHAAALEAAAVAHSEAADGFSPPLETAEDDWPCQAERHCVFSTIRVDNHLYFAALLRSEEPDTVHLRLPILIGIGGRHDGKSLLSYLMRKHATELSSVSLVKSLRVSIEPEQDFYVDVVLSLDPDRIDLQPTPEVAEKAKIQCGQQSTRFAKFYDFRAATPNGNLYIRRVCLTLKPAKLKHFTAELVATQVLFPQDRGSINLASLQKTASAASFTQNLTLEYFDPYFYDDLFPKSGASGRWRPFFDSPKAGTQWLPTNVVVDSVKVGTECTLPTLDIAYTIDLKARKPGKGVQATE